MAEANSSTMEPEQKPQLIFCCKKCRRIVAGEENVIPHEQGKGDASFGKRRGADPKSSPECGTIFVEPLKWMQTVEEGHVAEKLYCLGCKARIGSFNWAGMQCSCGAWVNPAFQLHKSRIDESSI